MIAKQIAKPTISMMVPSPTLQPKWPNCIEWISRAQLAIGLICLLLQLASTCVSGTPIINLAVPFLFVTAGFTSVIVHSCQPTSHAAISVSVLHGVSSFAAFAALVAPLLGLRSAAISKGDVSGAEIVFVLLAFVTLSGGVLSLLISVLDWRYSFQIADASYSVETLMTGNCMLGLNNDKTVPSSVQPVVHEYETLKPLHDFSEC